MTLANCYDKNKFGECRFFEDIINEEPVQPEEPGNQEEPKGE